MPKTKVCTPQKPCSGAYNLDFVNDPDAVGLNVTHHVNTQNYNRGLTQLYRFPKKDKERYGKFVWLNFCPWCGANLAKFREQLAKGKPKK